MQYMFIFGRDPELSLLELVSYLNLRNIRHRMVDSSELAAVVEMEKLDFGTLIRNLGGTVKIAAVGDEDYYLGSSNRIRYAVSDYGYKALDALKAKVKKELKPMKLKAMYKPGKQGPLRPYETLAVMEEGFELVAYKKWVGKVIACSNPKEYEERDELRPKQRHEQMISIRLAKILVNIVAKPKDVLLDPFCGYGILLQEAMLLGHDVIGVDNNPQCVNASKINLDWTRNKYRLNSSIKVINGDSTMLSNFVKKADCIATEPHLGPILKKLPTKEVALKTVKQLERLYSQVLKEFSKVANGRIAIIMPRFRLHTNERISMGFLKLLRESGLKPISKDIPIIYSAPKSRMDREIWVISR